MHEAAAELSHAVGGIEIVVGGDYRLRPEHGVDVARTTPAPELTLRLDASRAQGPLRPSGRAAAEADSWAAFVDGDVVRICAKSGRHSPAEIACFELPRDGLTGRYLYHEEWPLLFRYPYDQLLIIHALGVGGGALMHAAAICGRDGALLVSGPSGAGKTTMSRACAPLGAAVLSDERTVVRPARDGQWVAGGTPWPGEGGFADNRSVPLRGLVMLEQSDRDELVALSPARALALLYRCHFPPLWDPVAAERTLSHLESLVRAVPAFLFRNRKGPDAARMLLDTVGGAS